MAFGQSETHNMVTYDTIIPYKCLCNQYDGCESGGTTLNWVVRITRPVNYFTAGNADTASRPMLLTMQGDEQVGDSTSFINTYGPHYWLANGWNGSVQLGNGTHYPLLVTVQQWAVNTRPMMVQQLLDSLFREFHPRSVAMAGLDGGVEVFGWYMMYCQTTGNEKNMQHIKAFVDLEGLTPGSISVPCGTLENYLTGFGHWAKAYGGRFFGLQGTGDPRNIFQITQNINDSVPGAAYFSFEGDSSGGHCCWNDFYNPAVTNWQNITSPYGNSYITTQTGTAPNTAGNYVYNPTTGNGLFQWMLRQGDTTLAEQTLPLKLKWNITLGEYGVPAIDSVGRAVIFSGNLALTGNNGAGTSGVPKAVTSNPNSSIPTMMGVANTIHGSVFIGIDSIAYFTGSNEQASLNGSTISPQDTLARISVDSRGVPLTGIALACGSYTQGGSPDTTVEGLFLVKHGSLSDTVFYVGHKKYGMAGDGSIADSIVNLPTISFSLASGKRVIQLTGEQVMIMLLNDGTVYTWGDNQYSAPFGRLVTGNNYATPVQVTGFDTAIVQVAGGNSTGVIALSARGKLWGWGTYSGYLGNAANTKYASPTDLTTHITSNIMNGTRTTITQIAGNSTCFHIIANDSTLWGWGDNAMGDIGNGVEANMSSPPSGSSPWFINPGGILILPQTLPVQVTGRHNFVHMYSGQLFCFHFAVLDALGNILWCGRNKGAMIPNGVIECSGDGTQLSGAYPNGWDIPYLTIVVPYAITAPVQQSVLGCHTGQVTTDCYSCGATTGATANAGSNQMVVSPAASLTGTASSTGKVIYTIWTQTSGPSSVIDLPSSLTPIVTLSTPGTYLYQLRVQDQGFDTAISTVTITYGSDTLAVSRNIDSAQSALAAPTTDPAEDMPLVVYPNPSSMQDVMLTFRNALTGKVSITLVNVVGTVVQTYQFPKTDAYFLQQLSLGGLEKGVYFIMVSMPGYQATRKLVRF